MPQVLGYNNRVVVPTFRRGFGPEIPAQAYTTQSIGDATNGIALATVYCSLVWATPGRLQELWNFTDSAAPNVTVKPKVGLYRTDPLTLKPTTAIGTTNRVLTLATSNTYGYNVLDMTADPITVPREDYYAICWIADVGITTLNAGVMRAIMNHEIPLRVGGRCAGDWIVTRSAAFTYTEGLPADFGSPGGTLTWTNSRGTKPASWDWMGAYWRPY